MNRRINIAKFKCPKCGREEEIKIPEDRCLHFHKCKGCGELITASEGSCCVICSYSDKRCGEQKSDGVTKE